MNTWRQIGRVVAVVVALNIAACSTTSPIGRDDTDSQQAAKWSQSPAAGLLMRAQTAMAQNDWSTASALLERAVRLDANHPLAWHLLAQVRWRNQAYESAQNLASRSLAKIDGWRRLEMENWKLIALARAALGDSSGAAEARAKWTVLSGSE